MGNPNWQKGMQSPNPSGRPKGIIDKRQKLTQALVDDAQAIANVVIQKAKEGDLQAATIVLNRVMPTLAAQADCVQFELDTSASLSKQAEQVLAAMANGNLAPDSAKQIIESINALGAIRQIDEFEHRLNALENNSNR